MKLKSQLYISAIKYLLSLTLTALFLIANASNEKESSITEPINPDQMSIEKITLGAGCFWCIEAVFQELQGVISVESGYAGGHVVNPSYKEVTTGRTGHAEVVLITFDPDEITFEEILEVFWSTHDPTTLNRQGYDVGTQYRSAIFYHNDDQRRIAEKSKAEVATELWEDPIVTEIAPLTNYSKAEDYHQDYYANNPNNSYCNAVINPKLAKFRKKYANRLKDQGVAP